MKKDKPKDKVTREFLELQLANQRGSFDKLN